MTRKMSKAMDKAAPEMTGTLAASLPAESGELAQEPTDAISYAPVVMTTRKRALPLIMRS